MTDTTISLRINKELREKMKSHDDINWSAVLRRAIAENLENKERVDLEKRKKAAKMMDEIRRSGAFDGGKNSTLIIREWRNRRK
jgi:hypothetical protein